MSSVFTQQRITVHHNISTVHIAIDTQYNTYKCVEVYIAGLPGKKVQMRWKIMTERTEVGRCSNLEINIKRWS